MKKEYLQEIASFTKGAVVTVFDGDLVLIQKLDYDILFKMPEPVCNFAFEVDLKDALGEINSDYDVQVDGDYIYFRNDTEEIRIEGYARTILQKFSVPDRWCFRFDTEAKTICQVAPIIFNRSLNCDSNYMYVLDQYRCYRKRVKSMPKFSVDYDVFLKMLEPIWWFKGYTITDQEFQLYGDTRSGMEVCVSTKPNPILQSFKDVFSKHKPAATIEFPIENLKKAILPGYNKYEFLFRSDQQCLITGYSDYSQRSVVVPCKVRGKVRNFKVSESVLEDFLQSVCAYTIEVELGQPEYPTLLFRHEDYEYITGTIKEDENATDNQQTESIA